MTLDLWPTLSLVVVVLSWFLFAAVFLIFGDKTKSPPDKKRAPGSLVGVVLQGMGYGLAWGIQRARFSPIIPLEVPGQIVLFAITLALATASPLFAFRARQTLGKEWSVTARLVEGHRLVTHGPYRIVRNPIYAGMFGMLLATGLAITHWIGLVIAIIVFATGTMIRVRNEEKLLRDAFGTEFEDYARRVPAVIPFLF
jgi:protein-S-isoprenylcysteine O-methyltransferase Ste14